MNTFGFSILAATGGYLVGLFGGLVLVETFSSNTHDKSLEAAMTGAFVVGSLMAVVAVIALLVIRSRRARSPARSAVVSHKWRV